MTKTIYNTEILPGENKIIKLPIGSLPTGTPIKIPIYVFNGKNDGPTVLLQGGLHGDEINGVETCKRMLVNEYFTKLKKGCVIVIPLLNVYGFIHFSRELPDGKDVNRSFPGSKLGSLAGRIAYYHTNEILPHIDFGIDFHTGGAMRSNYPQIRYTPECETSEKLAQLFNAPIQFESKLIAKSFRATANKQNKPIIVFEGGESMRFDELAINEGINGSLKILAEYDMIDQPNINSSKNNTVTLCYRKWIRARKGGIFTSNIYNGDSIEKDQVLGYITDAYGNRSTVIKAPFDGYVFCINNHPLVNQGDALFHIGKENLS
ncbi:succinylglutamate desuccinylase/aspartoacylase family protein [Pseudofulvibacter geojedonensis]|uniref:Succinylglutamate desuccinylase/aspartoacylase family protein n=1 Tax=Pseudofulvibacter geojedonensis TaxID=1123758 RepID=A0ABW3I4P4_9FLAO